MKFNPLFFVFTVIHIAKVASFSVDFKIFQIIFIFIYLIFQINNIILKFKILCYILFVAKLMQNPKINIQMNSLNSV